MAEFSFAKLLGLVLLAAVLVPFGRGEGLFQQLGGQIGQTQVF
jgi:hypothetical protein